MYVDNPGAVPSPPRVIGIALLFARAVQGKSVGRSDNEVMCGVIGRLSVLLLDGFREEEQANPAASETGATQPQVTGR